MATTLVLRDRQSRALGAHVVPQKGGMSAWAFKQGERDLIKWGIRGGFTLRSDQEDALKDYAAELVRSRIHAMPSGSEAKHRFFDESSPVAESQTNGFIEIGVKNLEGMVRTIKGAF